MDEMTLEMGNRADIIMEDHDVLDIEANFAVAPEEDILLELEADLVLVVDSQEDLVLSAENFDDLILEDSFPGSDPYERYAGPYIVIPRLDSQRFETENKVMEHDMTVQKIPVIETTNPTGGKTVVIG